MAVRRPRLDDGAGQLPQGPRRQGDVQEARPGDIHAFDAGDLPQPSRDGLRDLAPGLGGGLGQPQRNIGRIVAVLRVLRALQHDLRGHVAGEIARVDALGHGEADSGSEIGRSHRSILEARVNRLRQSRELAVRPPAHHSGPPRLDRI